MSLNESEPITMSGSITGPAIPETQASVAVIIPCYNGEKFIRRALESVLNQTLPATEIFVVDDGSKDRTLQILESEYPNKVILISQANGGPARARNAAMRVASSEFFAFLDADDWWLPTKLERQVESLRRHPEAVLNYTSLRRIDEADGHVVNCVRTLGEPTWPNLRWSNWIPPSCVMVRRSAVLVAGEFDVRLRGNEDWAYWFKLRQLGPFCITQELVTDYRVSPGGLSGDGDHMFKDFMQMLDDTLLSGLTGWRRAVMRRRIIAAQAFNASMAARDVYDRAMEIKYMTLSMCSWPSPFWLPNRMKACAVTFLRAGGLIR